MNSQRCSLHIILRLAGLVGFGSVSSVSFAGEPGTVISWGTGYAPQDVPPAGLANVRQIACGGSHFLALRSDGVVIGWGYNDYGQAAPPALAGVVQIAGGERHSVAVHESGSVTCWGDRTYGQCDKPSGVSGVVQASAGIYHTVVLRSDGGVQAWGANWSGQTTVPAIGGARQVACGGYFSLALRTDSTVIGWGDGSRGQTSPPAGLNGVRQVVGGLSHSAALKDDGTVVVWGASGQNQHEIPAGLNNVVQIGAINYGVIALRSNGALVAWGSDGTGNLPTVPSGAAGLMRIATSGPGYCVIGLYGVLGTVGNVKPISGPATGGTRVEISGSNFQSTDAVTIGGLPATNVTFVSSSMITATTPPGFPGEAVVAVGNASATSFYYRPECGSDLDQNGSVDGGDLAILLLDWGQCYATATSPQPDDSTPFLLKEESAPAVSKAR